MNMQDLIHSNLPTSFDVTPLLSKLERLEKNEKKKKKNDSQEVNLIQRVKLIELDPYASSANGDKTRLFLAVAFGENIVVAKLIASELGHIHDNNDTTGVVSNREGGWSDDIDGEEEEDDDSLEWIDVSDDRVLPRSSIIGRSGNGETDEIGGPSEEDPVVVLFPPSCAESLPQKSNDDGISNANVKDDSNASYFTAAEITSCALIPSPAIITPTSTENKLMTQRTVALMLGTANDQVLSLLLNVTTQTQTAPNNPDDEQPSNNIRFVLEYDDCKTIENGELQEEEEEERGGGLVDIVARYPSVHEILPYGKMFHPENNGMVGGGGGGATCSSNDDGGKEEEEGVGSGNLDEHFQVFHPSMQSNVEKGNKKKEVKKCSGIKSISFCRDPHYLSAMNKEKGEVAMMSHDAIWITYGNGTMVKLPSWKPFLSFGSIGGGSPDVLVGGMHTIIGNGSSVIPFHSPFQSPLDVPPPHIMNQHNRPPVSTGDEMESICQGPNTNSYWKLLSSAVSSRDPPSQRADPAVHALVLAGQSAPASTPPISFNSSRVNYDPSPRLAQEGTVASSEYESTMLSQEGTNNREMNDSLLDMSEDEQYGPVTGTVVEGTAALVKGALGAALGAVRWGLGGGVGSGVNDERGHFDDDDDTPLDEFMEVDDTIDDSSANHGMPPSPQQPESTHKMNSHHSFMKRQVKDLFPWPLSSASFPFSDIPRRFESATVDPSGSLVATTDNLGRVILFDLETNQPIRMFKGMRNVACFFAELPTAMRGIASYLVIHLRQRGSVEVYRLQQGPRVTALAVPQQKNCVVVECYGPPSQGSTLNSFLLERIDDSDKCHHFIMDKLVIDDPNASVASTSSKQTPTRQSSQSENKMQLQLLMQLLAPDTNIQCNAQTVLATFKSIRALADLGEGLDALSRCHRLENEMGVNGSSLHSQACTYCKARLSRAKDIESQEGSGIVRKDAISYLSLKLGYHDRLGRAYNILHRYESRNGRNSTRGDDQDGTGMLSPWASEALSWISAASGNDALKTRFAPTLPNDVHSDNKPLGFSRFAMACQSNGDDDRVYLTKVKRSRLPILRRVFRPLLQDLFVFKVVNSLFGHLGIDEDFDIQQQYFGEWCSTLPTHDIAKSNMSNRTWRPMIRWLQDLILSAYDMTQHGPQKPDDDFLRKTAVLESLMKFCMEMEDLPKAFLLAVICMEAVSSASIQLEQKTYGKITQLESIRPWEDLLRKLRVCLLVSLRLGGDVNPSGGVNPMTVSSVSHPDLFSTYAWIARDELSLSHENRVVIALESACLSSSESFYPSTVDGDNGRHRKIMFQSCTNPSQASFLQNPSGLINDMHSRPLIFYLSDHARFTTHLAANRALILASMWGQSPGQLDLLKHAISALQTVVDCVEDFSLATLVEIYQSRIRPVCRAMLFGFGEHELSEDVVAPLIEDPFWSREFITIVKQILSMIIECISKVPQVNAINMESSEMWPPLRECPILSCLKKKLRDVQLSSLEHHHTVMFALEMTGSTESLESAVPSFDSLFLIGTLFSEMPPLPKGSSQQKGLLDTAIVDHAEKTSSPVVDNFSIIMDVELFGKALGLDSKYVRTQYLIEMIRLGKDTSINDLLGASSSSLDKATFTEKAVQILCGRLDATITSLKQTKQYRGILSLLDADASRWVREEAAKCLPSQRDNYATASLITTHSMILRVQSMSEDVEDSLSGKIDALCLMSGTLLKAVQAQEQESVMNV